MHMRNQARAPVRDLLQYFAAFWLREPQQHSRPVIVIINPWLIPYRIGFRLLTHRAMGDGVPRPMTSRHSWLV
ncbi:hypothetical protein V2G26_000826 [Clonostachys chloroleuca]